MSNTDHKEIGFGNPNMHGRIFVLTERTRWLTVSKDTMEDARLSYQARGLLAYLLCKPPNWVVVDAELRNHVRQAKRGEGDHQIKESQKELRDHGYFRRYKRKNARNQVCWVTLVFETPQLCMDRSDQQMEFEYFLQQVIPGSLPFPVNDKSDEASHGANSGSWQSAKSAAADQERNTAEAAIPQIPPHGDPPDGSPGVEDRAVVSTHGAKLAKSKAAAADDSFVELENALKAERITGKKLNSLMAEHPVLTAEMVREISADAKSRGKGPGVIIQELEARIEAQRAGVRPVDAKATRRRTAFDDLPPMESGNG